MEREDQISSLNSPLIKISSENIFELLNRDGNDEEISCSSEKKKKILEEVKKQLWLAGPLIAVSLLQYCLQVISVMFVAHLGELKLSGASMATSFATVTGFSLMTGMASALDTLCGQSYGAKQYHMLGIHMQRAMFVLLLVSIPLSFIWANTKSIIIAAHQDSRIAEEAGLYARFMIPSLFANAVLQCLVRFLRTQNIVFPMMLSSGITTLMHIFVCWVLVFKSGLGSRGSALANAISYWFNALLLAIYVKLSPSCENTWKGFSKEALQNIFSFVRLAIPSAVMVCFEMWSFEMMVLLSGLLPNPELETSVLSISLNTAATVWMIPFGLSGAVRTFRSSTISSLRRGGDSVIEGIFVGSVLILIRNIWGYAYSNETEVVNYVASMLPILAISNFLDGLQCVLSGTARGCGWQKIGAYINLGSYYLVGIPCAILLAFVLHIGGRGLWLGIICALIVQASSFFIITIRTSWEHEAKKAIERVYKEAIIPVNIVS